MRQDEPPKGSLRWGVKQSFRSYVEATGGTIETLGGADRAADGGFVFAVAPGGDLTLDAEGAPVGRFLGEVSFQAHGGMLAVRLADPALEVGASGPVLTMAEGGAGGRRVEIARLDLAAATTGEGGERIIPTALTLDGSQVLGDHYPPTTALDPVILAGA